VVFLVHKRVEIRIKKESKLELIELINLIVLLGERTNCMHRNRGNLTVGMKNETVEIVGIIFPRPLPHTPPPKTYGFGNNVLLPNFY
jgi:hypothetical protein